MARDLREITRSLDELFVPSIAILDGPAIGAGCDLAFMCDIRIASEDAVMGVPEKRCNRSLG